MTFETRFQQKLVLKIAAEIDRKAASVVDGHSKSFEDYRAHTSRIRALRDVLAMCDEVATELAKQ